MTIAYITAGGAGMYCGSCMNDNTLAAAVTRLGRRFLLIPAYTPIRTDEDDVSIDRVFLGGINVYLQQKIPLLRFLPRFLDRWLDNPRLIQRVASGRIETKAAELGALTVSMLRGDHGRQKKEFRGLVSWLEREIRPGLMGFTNILIAGCAPLLKRRIDAPIVVTLQGDDLFLESLEEPYRARALEAIGEFAKDIDAFIVHSEYYADFMSEYLGLPRERMRVVRLGISSDAETTLPRVRAADTAPTIGYMARICPEKGLHLLVEAFIELKRAGGRDSLKLEAAGWLGDGDRAFFEEQLVRLEAAGVRDAFNYAGVVDRHEKFELLRRMDVLSVPTTYREPKGLFVLEALSQGVPVVLPAHGAFPELIEQTGGGETVPPGDASALAGGLAHLLDDPERRRELGKRGRARVLEDYSAEAMARRTLEIYRELGWRDPGPS